jgi:hypothetical protein
VLLAVVEKRANTCLRPVATAGANPLTIFSFEEHSKAIIDRYNSACATIFVYKYKYKCMCDLQLKKWNSGLKKMIKAATDCSVWARGRVDG